ncbi:carbamoyltransferase C-terminal domain-containing protein [Streptomyces sp. DHE17-7]|uniref:carbamoyltransferase C-terminal domain-containing protein n=1 Tax=Streptomyces sp. DHE17-7 TaxID=2759949 RepID=UPI0022EAF2C3|nr:carbamoyltransferase C-terminal domain-containing protein [Streptomyces sp. DHE17-7]
MEPRRESAAWRVARLQPNRGHRPRTTADVLAAGGVAGWFQGRAEGGPRALGHRSMVAVPNPEGTRDRVNVRISRTSRAVRPSLPEHARGGARGSISHVRPAP